MLEVRDWTEFIETCLTQAPTRQRILKHITVNAPSNWQNVHTPFHIVREMCDLIPNEDLGYYVFFSNEFLEVLIHERNIDAKKVLFLPDNELEGKLMKKVYGCNYHVLDKSILQNKTVDLSGVPMKFDKLAVVGNPPYQEMDGGHESSAVPLYNLFIEETIKNLKPSYHSFIIPSRWMNGGKGLTGFRSWFAGLKPQVIKHFSGPSTVFKEVSIQGGVCYFLLNKHHNDLCKFNDSNCILERELDPELIIPDNIGFQISSKVNTKPSLSQKVFSHKPFGLRTNFSGWVEEGIECYTIGTTLKKVPEGSYTDVNNIKDQWKVCTSKANGGILSGEQVPMLVTFVANPGQICTETYIVVTDFDNKAEADNFQSYMKTKFFRFLLKLCVGGNTLSKSTFRFVPDMEDYSKVWTDEELYKHFNLSQEEIDYIESKIK